MGSKKIRPPTKPPRVPAPPMGIGATVRTLRADPKRFMPQPVLNVRKPPIPNITRGKNNHLAGFSRPRKRG